VTAGLSPFWLPVRPFLQNGHQRLGAKSKSSCGAGDLAKDFRQRIGLCRSRPSSISRRSRTPRTAFCSGGLKSGEKRPALDFSHMAASMRQCSSAGINVLLLEFLRHESVSRQRGYVVLALNYRSGIGYGRAFEKPRAARAAAQKEYEDVVAAGKYLQTRSDVDGKRIDSGANYGGYFDRVGLGRQFRSVAAGWTSMASTTGQPTIGTARIFHRS